MPIRLAAAALAALLACSNAFAQNGTSGHLDGIFSIGKVADRIGAFLQK